LKLKKTQQSSKLSHLTFSPKNSKHINVTFQCSQINVKYAIVIGLPADLSVELCKVANHVQEAKNTIQNLETALAKGKAIQEAKQGWISGEHYLPEDEIRCQFHHRFTCTFYTQRSQKHKTTLKT